MGTDAPIPSADAPSADDPRTVYRKDYRAPTFLVPAVDLDFDLDAKRTKVRSQLTIRRAEATAHDAPLVLDGEGLELADIRLDGEELAKTAFRIEGDKLIIESVPDAFTLETVVYISPAENSALEGLYLTGELLATQCEATGFRRITWFPDRPDILSVFRVRLVADRDKYPVLLSNGNPTGQSDVGDGRHCCEFEDPFPKPCYLFAIVAGRLSEVRAEHVRGSGKPVTVSVFVSPGYESRAFHARDALIAAMAWDEKTYGLECDVDRYAMVSVPDFNMGAMENKGLNIFNDACLLADPETATDADYERILAVVAHEYFHNWTGNRVTCRDWFQLSLKESLTVFREQQFMDDALSAGVQRIQNVRMLRNLQFPEDAGPLAHPVRPESYVEMNNFYTMTVYEKGAEIIRMLHTLCGWNQFRQGVLDYLSTHDGTAATIDDFVASMAAASGRDLSQFMRWYSQAGTPSLTVRESFDPSARRMVLEFSQDTAATPGQPEKRPLHIPVRYAIFDQDGGATLRGTNVRESTQGVFELTEASAQLVIDEIPGRPVVSILRGFSAPVRLKRPLRPARIRSVIGLENDPFARWESLQFLYQRYLGDEIASVPDEDRVVDMDMVITTVRACVEHMNLESALMAEMLKLPDESELADAMDVIDVDAVVGARDGLLQKMADVMHEHWMEIMEGTRPKKKYRFAADDAGRRSLRAVAMRFRVLGGGEEGRIEVQECFQTADNMSDMMNALVALNAAPSIERDTCLTAFEMHWADERLVFDKWFALQAAAPLDGGAERVRHLLEHPKFDETNPNRVRALLGGFSRNLRNFHAADGSGYRLIGESIERLDSINPQVAARLVAAFTNWRRMDPTRSQQMHSALQRLSDVTLSADCSEMVSRSLASH